MRIVQQRLEQGQRAIGVAGALLGPGGQEGSHQLAEMACRQRVEAQHGAAPVAGTCRFGPEQHLRHRVVRQPTCQRDRFGPPAHDRGQQGLMQQLRIGRGVGDGAQELLCRRVRIGLVLGELTDQKIRKFAGHLGRGLLADSACRRGWAGVGRQDGGRQRSGEQ